MTELRDVTIETVGRGCLPERFEHALQEVVDSIEDPNTEWKKQREIVIKVKFKPSESRSEAHVAVEVDTKLPGLAAVGAAVFIGRRDGRRRIVTRDVQQEDAFSDGVLPMDRAADED